MSSDRKKDEQPDRSRPSILGPTLAHTTFTTLTPPRAPLPSRGSVVSMSWDDAVAEYRRAPSDQSFQHMAAAHHEHTTATAPVVSEVVYPMAVNRHTPMFMRHLTKALFLDKRLLEARHFADRWLALEPNCFDALNLKASICVERGDLRTAADCYNRMGPQKPDSLEVARLRLMMYLRLDQLSDAKEHAQEFLRFRNLTPPDVYLVAETGVRARAPMLVAAAVLRRGRSTYGQRVERELLDVARLGLLWTMSARAGAS